MKDYSKYIAYYPESVKAIKEFRLDTGAGLAEAKAIIDDVFIRRCASKRKSSARKREEGENKRTKSSS